MSESLRTEQQKFKAKSSESEEDDDSWQINYDDDDGSFMNGKSNNKIVMRSYQP